MDWKIALKRASLTVVLLASAVADAADLDAVSPAQQRVYDLIELTGSGFGAQQGTSEVRFSNGATTVSGGRARIWRDNFIAVRVPIGERIGDVNTPTPSGPLSVTVVVAGDVSAPRPFEVIRAATGSLAFRELTNIGAGDLDSSHVLGSPNLNSGRTKDADLGDVNGDGFPDLLDNNSNNVDNDTHAVLRINNLDKTFRAVPFEPRDAADTGTFASTVSGADFFGNAVTYDSDLVDLNNDGLPDLVQTATMGGGTNRMRVHINNPTNPGTFTEATGTWLPGVVFSGDHSPDDVDTGDVNLDGFMDIAVSLRRRIDFGTPPPSETKVFLNNGGTGFNTTAIDVAPTPDPALNWSTHDTFFLDANADGLLDIILCHEDGKDSELFLHNGNLASPGFTLAASPGITVESATGLAADLNGDGFDDFVLAQGGAFVYLNDPDNPGNFTQTALPLTGAGTFYDIEMGDIDLDGDVDVVGARLSTTADNTATLWRNDGTGGFVEATSGGTTSMFPGAAGYQRLSADLLDFDQDGDLDLYLTGADGQDVGLGFGKVPNQFFENELLGLNLVEPTVASRAYAGTSGEGRKVLLRIRSDLPVPGLGPGSFLIFVDGALLPSTSTITATRIEAEYWLLVLMPPNANGLYDLEVALNSNPAIRDLERRALEYDDARFFDRAVSLDRSHSMSGADKMASAQAAARLFVDLTADDDQIGVVSFKRDADDGDGVLEQAELARDEFGMVPAQIGVMDQRPAARAAVDLTEPDAPGFAFETSIGAGLQQALDMVNAAGDTDHEWEIVLLSDGRENLAPNWEEPGPRPPVMADVLANDPAVTVHTVAIGGDAAVEVLQDIATATGGKFHNLLEGSASFALMSRLADTYKEIDESMRGEERFYYREGLPQRLGEFTVQPDYQTLSVAFHWNQPNAVKQVALIDPDGTLVQHNAPLVLAFSDAKHATWRIQQPKPGVWRYRVAASDNGELEFFAAASAIADLACFVGPMDVLRDGETFKTTVRLLLADRKPVRGAKVVAELLAPNREKSKLQFFDDGKHGDGAPGDGVYAATVSSALYGAYTLSIKATGRANIGGEFERHKRVSFVFPSPDPNRPGNGEPPVNQGQLDELEDALKQCRAELGDCRRREAEYKRMVKRYGRDTQRLTLQVRQLNELVRSLRGKLRP